MRWELRLSGDELRGKRLELASRGVAAKMIGAQHGTLQLSDRWPVRHRHGSRVLVRRPALAYEPGAVALLRPHGHHTTCQHCGDPLVARIIDLRRLAAFLLARRDRDCGYWLRVGS